MVYIAEGKGLSPLKNSGTKYRMGQQKESHKSSLTSSTSFQEKGEAEQDKMLGMARVILEVAYLWFDLRRRNSWKTWGSKV